MFALESLALAGETYETSERVRKACSFLLGKQMADGGWGESYEVGWMGLLGLQWYNANQYSRLARPDNGLDWKNRPSSILLGVLWVFSLPNTPMRNPSKRDAVLS